MGTYVLRRILIAIPILFGITLIAFTALSLAPGDPLTARMDPALLAQMTPEALARARAEFGLDKPLPVRYVIWLGDILRGNLGYAAITHRSVAGELAARIGPTLILMGTSLIIGIGVGVPLGVIAAVKQYTLIDYALAVFSMSFIVIPGFVIGLIAIYVFGVFLGWLPTSGMYTLGKPESLVDLGRHLVMPATILGFSLAAPLMRYTRASMLEVLGSDFITTARSKGIRSRSVMIRHGLRNALLPVITVIGLTLPDLVAGAVITEQVFTWPGMGQLAVTAAHDRDPALLMGVILLVATAVLISNLLADVLYAVADPRVRLGRSA